MSQIFPKMLDNVGVQLVSGTNDLVYVIIVVTVYENINLVDVAYDSQISQRYVTPQSQFSYVTTRDQDTNRVLQINCKLGDLAINFSDGEYVNNLGQVYDLDLVYDAIFNEIGN